MTYFNWFDGSLINKVPIAPLVPQVMAATGTAYTVNRPLYTRYKVTFDHKLNGCQIYCDTFTASATYEAGWYTYSTAGDITKLTGGGGTVNVTAVGEFTINFSQSIALTKGTDVFFGLLKVGGINTILSRASGPATNALNFYGLAGVSVLPTTELAINRAAQTTIPYVEFISA